jgi:hypothetical protein
VKDIALDPATNDVLGVGTDGGFLVVEGVEAFAQRLRIRFRFLKGDWSRDPQEGMSLLDEMEASKLSPERAESILRQVVESTPGFGKMLSFQTTSDQTTRALRVKLSCTTDDGAVLNLDEPFIIIG